MDRQQTDFYETIRNLILLSVRTEYPYAFYKLDRAARYIVESRTVATGGAGMIMFVDGYDDIDPGQGPGLTEWTPL